MEAARPRAAQPHPAADTLGLSVREVETALSYGADYREDIDQLIARHHADQDEALAAWQRRQALDVA